MPAAGDSAGLYRPAEGEPTVEAVAAGATGVDTAGDVGTEVVGAVSAGVVAGVNTGVVTGAKVGVTAGVAAVGATTGVGWAEVLCELLVAIADFVASLGFVVGGAGSGSA